MIRLPVVVFSGIGYCSAKGSHEIVYITDGFKGYAYGPATEAEMTRNSEGDLVVTCNQPTLDAACDGVVEFSLSDETISPGWNSIPEHLALLATWGQWLD